MPKVNRTNKTILLATGTTIITMFIYDILNDYFNLKDFVKSFIPKEE